MCHGRAGQGRAGQGRAGQGRGSVSIIRKNESPIGCEGTIPGGGGGGSILRQKDLPVDVKGETSGSGDKKHNRSSTAPQSSWCAHVLSLMEPIVSNTAHRL